MDDFSTLDAQRFGIFIVDDYFDLLGIFEALLGDIVGSFGGVLCKKFEVTLSVIFENPPQFFEDERGISFDSDMTDLSALSSISLNIKSLMMRRSPSSTIWMIKPSSAIASILHARTGQARGYLNRYPQQYANRTIIEVFIDFQKAQRSKIYALISHQVERSVVGCAAVLLVRPKLKIASRDITQTRGHSNA